MEAQCIINNVEVEQGHKLMLNIGTGTFKDGDLDGSIVVGVNGSVLVNFNDDTSITVSAQDVAKSIIEYKQQLISNND